ncbi:hypothetical protein PR003_g28559 [Phytophthora rubi]|uniref:Uncharacterized protein n=1 Tax=Phytophthora rubi TaxID=129364 RepID=A0A6A3HII0_9STRA|nr:hypothetical protein PR001_g27921 [Phytophthora rubi]KAE8969420.1 hypothetical protein PR002_g27438 [Phytophthora rubi]KAE9278323.1 hypothetical protein PR003_g28559 [Phytophthora rubi]
MLCCFNLPLVSAHLCMNCTARMVAIAIGKRRNTVVILRGIVSFIRICENDLNRIAFVNRFQIDSCDIQPIRSHQSTNSESEVGAHLMVCLSPRDIRHL